MHASHDIKRLMSFPIRHFHHQLHAALLDDLTDVAVEQVMMQYDHAFATSLCGRSSLSQLRETHIVAMYLRRCEVLRGLLIIDGL